MTHPLTTQELIAKLDTLQLNDPNAVLNFTARLQREQYGWSRSYAERVTREYTRFLILAAISERHVTPSEAVDQAWHLHIIYTESYHEWCDTLFGRYLHHGPTKGGKVEGERFEGQYEHTLALYERTFVEAPPKDIWPDAKERFDRHDAGLWIQPTHYWVIPRTLAKRIIVGTLAAVVLCLLGLSIATGHPPLFRDTHAQSAEQLHRSSSEHASAIINTGEMLLILFCGGILITGLIFVVLAAARGQRGGNDGGGSGFGCGGATGCSSAGYGRGIHGSAGGFDAGGGDSGASGCGTSGCGASGCGASGCGGGGCGS